MDTSLLLALASLCGADKAAVTEGGWYESGYNATATVGVAVF